MLNRRSFLQAGAIAAGSYFLPEFALGEDKQEKSCVFLWLGGGIASTEFINPIPSAPVEYRSVTGAIDTKSGYQIGGSFTNLAGISDKFTTVRSFKHKDGNHSTATGWMLSGTQMTSASEGSPQKDPSHGSMLSYYFGENNGNGVPTYVKINNIQYDAAAWLGSKYTGFENDEQGIKNLTLSIKEEQFKRRLEIVSLVEKNTEKRGLNKDWTDLRSVASKVIMGNAGKAFNLKSEDEKYRNLYDIEKSQLGKSLLLARRLVEAGTKLSTIHYGGWDMHNTIAKDFPVRAAELDKFLTVFILDLEQRGLLKNTLVVVASEFSRTPKINGLAGRDHWPGTNSLLLFGGNYGGNLIGTTDGNNSEVTSNPFEPKDLNCTILNHFGIDQHYKMVDNLARPRHFIEQEAKLII